VILLLTFCHAAVNAAALLARGSLPHAPEGHALTASLAAGVVEWILYRPALLAARLGGLAATSYPGGSRRTGAARS